MKQLDNDTTRVLKIPSVVLMERAALFTVDAIMNAEFDLSRVVVLAGCGNNGGDGVCVARILKERSVSSDVFVIGEPHPDSECAHQIETAGCYEIPVTYATAEECTQYLKSHPCTLLIDAIFGVGLNKRLSEDYGRLIGSVNDADCKVVSIDIPTGVNASTGAVETEAVKSDLTVTFGYYKIGQFLYPGCTYCGKVICDPIGIIQDASFDQADLKALEECDLLRITRDPNSHKGTFGKVLLIAGSKDIGGAAALSAEAAFRSGAGMVRIFTHEKNRELLLERIPEVMVTTYDTDPSGLGNALAWADVIGIGPGISASKTAHAILRSVFTDCDLPVIMDADAFLHLKTDPALYALTEDPARTVIITPHMKEFSFLTDISIADIRRDPVAACRDYAAGHHQICVLKDARTVISDGNTTYLNLSGNSGMATAGSGDVLLGLMASLLGQGLDGVEAAAYACFIHGLAGDAASASHGQAGMVASDMIGYFKNYLR
ncbi:MAG: NAD(P)H-hydrate dehydratase [Lachnospiraceae bacterium]|nr:NAD(P)H-hydrate dehydratase [Lachnospiraceae bacterium]